MLCAEQNKQTNKKEKEADAAYGSGRHVFVLKIGDPCVGKPYGREGRTSQQQPR